MTEQISNNNSSVQEMIQTFNMLEKINSSLSAPIKFKNSIHLSSSSSSTISEHDLNPSEIEQQKTATINRQSKSALVYASPVIIHKKSPISTNRPSLTYNNSDDIGLEVIEFIETRKQTINTDETQESIDCAPSIIEDYEENDIQQQPRDSTPPRPPPPRQPTFTSSQVQDEAIYQPKRSLPLSNFLLEIGALVVVSILCMILVSAIREEQANLRTTIQVVYIYIYLVSIIWIIWCTFDIIKFRRQWMKLTSSAKDPSEYMDIVEHYSQNLSYFPDIHNTGGLFMRVGAGLLCMGSLLLTVIELAKTIEMTRADGESHDEILINYSEAVFVTKSITFIFRFLFHCLQFIFLFRYGNIIIDRHHFIAKIGLIHIIIANFCTWFEAIVIETLEELHKHSESVISTDLPMNFNTTTTITTRAVEMTTVPHIFNFLKAAPVGESSSQNTTTTALEFIEKIQSSVGIYLYPCLIEYSLISVTVFYIMWRNIGKTENRSFVHFGDRHIYTVNCSRASYGLVLGGIIFLLTILTLILDYILDPSTATPIAHITELTLLVISLVIVSISFIYTTNLYYDQQAHVDIFDQILILVTTVGDFAYTFFGLFAAIFIKSSTIEMSRSIEIAIGVLAICQTFLQSAFILDALKRRSISKSEIRKKPGRQLITALLLINLAIWMHDSLAAKKGTINSLQNEYYNPGTWSIVQAFTSPLSIFYRFHSSVCLADIWQEVYQDHRNYRPGRKDTSNHSIRLNNIQH